MQHKIFIGISLPDAIRRRLGQAIERLPDLPLKWVPEENLHATLLFLGYVDDADVAAICETVRKVADESESFDILFERIGLGPEPGNPRLVWLQGAENEEMRQLSGKLEQALTHGAAPKKSFRPHVTLGRIRHEKWGQLEPKPVIDQKFSVSVPAGAVDIFESVMENGKSKFILLESCPLA